MPNKALHWTGIPLRSIPASELGRYGTDNTKNPGGGSGSEEARAKHRKGAAHVEERCLAPVCRLGAGSSGRIDARFIYQAAFAGNTTMQHLLCGVDPSPMAAVPFAPAYGRGMVLSAREMGAVAPGDLYTVSATLRTEDVSSMACVQLAFVDAAGGFVQDVVRAPKGTMLTGTTDWLTDGFQAEVPPKAIAAEVRLFINGPGKIWASNINCFC